MRSDLCSYFRNKHYYFFDCFHFYRSSNYEVECDVIFYIENIYLVDNQILSAPTENKRNITFFFSKKPTSFKGFTRKFTTCYYIMIISLAHRILFRNYFTIFIYVIIVTHSSKYTQSSLRSSLFCYSY